MTEILLLVAIGLVIGLVLGGLGGGGAILTVPALVFLVGQQPVEATGGSLVIVGLAAITGAISHVRGGTLAWRTGVSFGAAGIPAAYAGSRLSAAVDPDRLLLAFAVLMIVVAVAMLRPSPSRRRMAADRGEEPEAPAPGGDDADGSAAVAVAERTDVRRASWLLVLAAGLGVGLLTGFFGVGGGFLIVPALALLLRLPMPLAIGTSLVVVAINSAAALVSRLGSVELDWSVLVPVSAAAMVATMLGRRIAARLPARRLTRGFALLLVLVAGYTGVRAAIGLAASGGLLP